MGEGAQLQLSRGGCLVAGWGGVSGLDCKILPPSSHLHVLPGDSQANIPAGVHADWNKWALWTATLHLTPLW